MATSERPRLEWSQRERQVLDLIAHGRTNGEIAEELGISFATAKWHVSELITKLGVRSREEVADAWRHERGFTRRLGRLATAVLGLPMLKLAAAGGAAAALCLTGAVAWAAFAGDGSTAAAPGPSPTATVIATPTDISRAIATPSRPDGCPTTGKGATIEEAHRALFCPVLNYPEIAAKNTATTPGGCVLTGAISANSGHWDNADFRGCTLDGVSLSGTLNGSDFEGVSARGLTTHTTLGSSDFRGADLTGADLTSAMLQGADFTDAVLLNADLTNAIVRGSAWNNTTCPDGTNSNDDAKRTCLGHMVEDYWPVEAEGWLAPMCPQSGPVGSTLCAPELYAGVTVGPDGKSCSGAGADLHGANLKQADFTGCDLSGADLSGADLEGASLLHANLAGADLSGAKLYQAHANGASFRDANLTHAILSQTTLDSADLTRAATDGALLNPQYNDTICPDGTNSDAPDGDNNTCETNR